MFFAPEWRCIAGNPLPLPGSNGAFKKRCFDVCLYTSICSGAVFGSQNATRRNTNTVLTKIRWVSIPAGQGRIGGSFKFQNLIATVLIITINTGNDE